MSYSTCLRGSALVLMIVVGLASHAGAQGLCDPDNPIHNCPSSYCTATSPGTQGLEQVDDFGPNQGNLRMFKYVPASLPANAPLVVVLHACSQNAGEYARLSGWNDMADKFSFAILYPETKCENNAMCCFNWAGEFSDPTNMIRKQGENQTMIDMVDKMIADHGINPDRVYVSGFSGGAAQTNLLLATWPDRFEAGASQSGIPYYCTDLCEEVSSPCLSPGKDRSPQAWGDLVLNAYASVEGHLYEGRYPRISIWHGTVDSMVNKNNQREMMEQWTYVHGLDQTPDNTDTVKGHIHEEHQDSSGQTLVEVYTIQGGQHGLAIDPGSGEDQCGTAGSYTSDRDICGAYYISKFFGLHGDVEDMPPSVRITNPQDQSQVSGVVTVLASASDDVGVARVDISVDGQVVVSDSTAPYEYEWDTVPIPSGQHTIQATAYDTADQSSSHQITVSKVNVIDDPPQVEVLAPVPFAVVCGVISVVAEASDDQGVVRVEFLVDGQLVHSASNVPYLFEWDTDAETPGIHQVIAKAVDTSSQSTGVNLSVRVGQGGVEFTDTFTGGGPDNPEWDLMDFSIDASEDHTGGGSASLHAAAQPGIDDFALVKKTSVRVELGSTPALNYVRMLDISCGQFSCGYLGPAAFRVKVQPADPPGEEEIIDFVDLTEPGQSHLEDSWTERSGIDLSAYSGMAVLLNFYVGAPYYSHSKAWIDDVSVSGGEGCTEILPPEISTDAPAVSGCCVDISGSISDPGGLSIAWAAAEIGGVVSHLNPDPDGSFAHQRCNLANGDYTASLVAVNELGAQGQAQCDFSIGDCEGTQPELTITALNTANDCVNIEGTAVDPDGDQLTVTISFDSESPAGLGLDASGGWSQERCGLAEGQHTVEVRAVDPVGLQDVEFAQFTIGAGSSPVLTISEVSTNENCVTIEGTATDPDGEIPTVFVAIDGSFETPVTPDDAGAWTFERCQLELGDHQASVRAVDAAGLQDLKSVDFTITGQSEYDPVVIVDTLTTNFDCVHMEGSATDPRGETLAVTIKIDSGSPNPLTIQADGSWEYDRCLLEEGTHSYSILAINRSGRRTTVEDEFEITGEGGGQKPVVRIEKLTTEKFCAHMEGSASDPDGDTLTVTASVDEAQPETIQLGVDGSWSYDWCGRAGDHTVVVAAADPIGLVGSATAMFDLEGDEGCGCNAASRSGSLAFLGLLGLMFLKRRKPGGRM